MAVAIEYQREDGRRARLIARDLAVVDRDADQIVEAHYWDEDDQDREPLLRKLLGEGMVRAVAYPTVGARDALQVFLRHGPAANEMVFACTVVSGAWVRKMLLQSRWIVEGFTLQVAPGEQLTVEGVRAAIQAWTERSFPGVVPPALAVELWSGPEGVPDDILELLIDAVSEHIAAGRIEWPELSEGAPIELEPDPDLAEPPYEDAA